MGKPIKKQIPKPAPQPVQAVQQAEPKKKFSFNLGIASLPGLTPYIPGLLLFFLALIICLLTYKDYGVIWDEPLQRDGGLLSYNYVFHGNHDLLHDDYANRGFYNFIPVGFELPLVIIEKMLNLTDSRDIYLMRHLATHILFLISALSLYVLAYRLFKNRLIASFGFIMIVLAPRIYAHSFFNTKDLPFLSIFIIILTVSQIAFDKSKPALFFLLGSLCGYATSIRNMGVMIGGFIFVFLVIDLISGIINKEKRNRLILNILSFSIGFCFLLLIAWPYLWKDPVHNFLGSFSSFSRFPWKGHVLWNGKYEDGLTLSWTYFPTWFLVTNPELWLIIGFAGIILISINFFKKPLAYLANTRERNFLLYLLCFFVPIMAVILLHSVIYDDWRHLYFVYPSFVLLALYFINKLLQTKYKRIVQGLCIIQLIFISYFMVRNHPFHQVYFNNFVSHREEYLHNNYQMDYWGASYKQAIEHLLKASESKTIKMNCIYKNELDNNILLLPEDDRNRVQFADITNADYFITNFWGDFYNYPMNKIEYAISVLNSTILCIYKVEKDPIAQKQYREAKIIHFKKQVAIDSNDFIAECKLGDLYSSNSQYDSSEVHYKSVIRLNPGNKYVLFTLSDIYMKQKRYANAIELLNKMLAINPDDENVHVRLGNAFLYSAQYDSSEVHDKRALQLNPKNADALNNLAGVYFFNKRYQQAIELYKKAIELRPDFVDPYANIGACYLYLNKYDSSISYLNKAISVNPTFNSSYEILVATYKAAAKIDSAKKYEAIAQKRDPGFKL